MLRMKISHFKRLTSLHPYHHDPIHSENFSTKLSYKQSTTSKVGVIVVVIIKMRTKVQVGMKLYISPRLIISLER